MHDRMMYGDRQALVAPSPEDLPLLFEASRILGRHAALSDAFTALCGLLVDQGGLGRAKIVMAQGGEGYRLGEGLAGRSAAEGRSIVEGSELALPILVGGETIGVLLGKAEGRETERAMGLGLAVAALVAEAWTLRKRIGRDAASADDVGTGAGEAGGIGSSALSASLRFEPVEESWEPENIIGRSAPMRELFSLMDRVAAAETTILVTGESGTGKELVARALHERSARAGKPFVAVNCAALPESVIESELFGHEKGAFTGALERRRGRFELADGGTLFLDEIGELGAGVQAKLLRVLQEGEYQRVGDSSTRRADVRIIAATNRDLERATSEGRFRIDLFWRLNVFPLRVPPLRERRSDIVLLADHFVEKLGRRMGKIISRISSPAIDLLSTYHWPGNVRELENCIERAVILSSDSVIHSYHLPPSLQSAESTGTGPASTLDAALARMERELLVEALKMSRGNAAAAARRLGISERRMGLALSRYRIDWRSFRTYA